MDYIEEIIQDNKDYMLGINKFIRSNLILVDNTSSTGKYRLENLLHSNFGLHCFLYFYIQPVNDNLVLSICRHALQISST